MPRVTDAERVARRLATACGFGNALLTSDIQFGPMKRWTPTNKRTGDGDETNPAATAGLTVCGKNRHGETTPDGLRQWDQTPRIGLQPRTRMGTHALTALAYARLTKPMGDWLRVYALQDWERWPNVRRHALLVLPGDPLAVDEAARMILWPRPKALRAQHYRMRRSDYSRWVAPAEIMLSEWLERAAAAYLRAEEFANEANAQIEAALLQ
jgi:hypothetical protein